MGQPSASLERLLLFRKVWQEVAGQEFLTVLALLDLMISTHALLRYALDEELAVDKADEGDAAGDEADSQS